MVGGSGVGWDSTAYHLPRSLLSWQPVEFESGTLGLVSEPPERF